MQEKLENKLAAQPLDFESFFSQKAMEMKASEVRELLKLVETSDVISLAGVSPPPRRFPLIL